MKKISYFGKEYTVSDDIKWVATSECGNVFAFAEEPQMFWKTWITVNTGKRIDILGAATKDWKNSLRKVDDILVKDGHTHADLLLKYAMIAQYDAEPWKYFEYETSDGWTPCLSMAAFNENVNYRLKPQEPKIQAGQIWVDTNGVEVTIQRLANRRVFTDINVGGITIPWSFKENEFFGNFKRKN